MVRAVFCFAMAFRLVTLRTMTAETFTAEALLLSPYERAQIAEAMMQSLMDEAQAKRDAAWDQWAEQQSELVRQGKVQLVDGPALVAELYQRCRA
jgi:Putative addiction module component